MAVAHHVNEKGHHEDIFEQLRRFRSLGDHDQPGNAGVGGGIEIAVACAATSPHGAEVIEHAEDGEKKNEIIRIPMRDEGKEFPPEVTEDGEHEEIPERNPDVKDQHSMIKFFVLDGLLR